MNLENNKLKKNEATWKDLMECRTRLAKETKEDPNNYKLHQKYLILCLYLSASFEKTRMG